MARFVHAARQAVETRDSGALGEDGMRAFLTLLCAAYVQDQVEGMLSRSVGLALRDAFQKGS
jgi:hypothetical protein